MEGIQWVGFPPPMLGPEPVRLPVYTVQPDFLCLEKPPGVALFKAETTGNDPRLPDAINRQVAAGKPELRRLGIQTCGPVTPLAPEVGGPVVLAMGKPALARLRDALGSRLWTFHYCFWSRREAAEPSFVCDRPVLHGGGMVPRLSRQHGKRTETAFSLRKRVGEWSLWQAETTYPRPGQVRLHAAFCGIPVAGDDVFAAEAAPLDGRKRPLWRGPALRLERLSGVDGMSGHTTLDPTWMRFGEALTRVAEKISR